MANIKSSHNNEEDHSYAVSLADRNWSNLRPDCENCFGLCCVAFYFSASEGFPIDKDAGQPCLNLQSDFRCAVHKNLWEKGFRGCTAYDCFGAGQKVAQVTFGGQDWHQSLSIAKQMFDAFLIMCQLHELLWYLTEAMMLDAARPIYNMLGLKLDETELITHLSYDDLIKLDVAAYRKGINSLLLQTSKMVRAQAHVGQSSNSGHQKRLGRGADLIAADLRKTNLRGKNLRGAYLIAADLRGADLSRTDLIGADFRDADLRGTDLSKSIFLTQAQINVAKGDTSTKLPPLLTRPTHWSTL